MTNYWRIETGKGTKLNKKVEMGLREKGIFESEAAYHARSHLKDAHPGGARQAA